MFSNEKIDKTGLAVKVDHYLKSKGVHTPVTNSIYTLTDDEKISVISSHIETCMKILGLDLTDDSLSETPNRVAKMWVKELYWGLDPLKFPKCTTVENKMHYDEMVVEKNIKVMSSCEHHLVTIDGSAHIAYIPKDKVLGLSKLNRIVDYYSRRPQIQERLTMQIGESLKYILDTDDIAVVIDATHYCVKSRGIEDLNSSTSTSFLSGVFKTDDKARKEYFDLIKGK